MNERTLSNQNKQARMAKHATGPTPAVPTQPLDRLRMLSEGPRWLSTRATIAARYLTYFLILVLAPALVQALLSQSPSIRHGGQLMWSVSALMLVTGSVASWIYPSQRTEIIAQTRHYLFGMCVVPATGVAGLIWFIEQVLVGPTTQADTLTSLMTFAVPATFVVTLVLPPIVFIKAVAGYYSLNRTNHDDTEVLTIMTRQDGLQR